MSEIDLQSSAALRAAPGTGHDLGMAGAVERAPLQAMPFDHIYLENVFPAAFYRKMLEHFPAPERFHPLRHKDAVRDDGSSTRMRLYLYPETLWRLPRQQRAVWGRVAAALMAPELELALKRKFRDAMEDRFRMPAEAIRLFPIPILVRDLPGYHIGIHADTLTKAVTVQFYLPRDAAQAHLGTVFHTTRQQDGSDRPIAMQFLPSTGYAFAVRKKESWHSARTTTEADGERRSIMLTYYVGSDPALLRKRWVQRAGIFFGKYPSI